MNNFIKQRWHLHILGGALTVTPLIWLLIKFDPSFDIGKIAQVFIAGFFGYVIGFAWEWYHGKFHESPFDYRDIWFTVLGAVIGTILL
jgi:glycopeptide antibiotics resistance protein